LWMRSRKWWQWWRSRWETLSSYICWGSLKFWSCQENLLLLQDQQFQFVHTWTFREMATLHSTFGQREQLVTYHTQLT
jgi:hypothetical protein